MRPWFRQRRYGLGFTPASWPGWVLTGAYVAVVFVLGTTLAESQPAVFWTVFGLATVAYLGVAFLTRDGGS
jgi:hypothetical protein